MSETEWKRGRRERETHKVGQERVVKLDVAAPSGVQVGELLAVRPGEVGKVLDLGRVHVLGEGVLAVPEVVPPARARAGCERAREGERERERTHSGAASVILTFLTSSGLTSDAVYSNSGLQGKAIVSSGPSRSGRASARRSTLRRERPKRRRTGT